MAIFVVYLWAGLPMKAKLSIMLVTIVSASFSYWWMERRLSLKEPYRLPRIPRPRHKVKGYRYLEEENSDESDCEGKREEEEEGEGEGEEGQQDYEQALERENN
ncbi:protein unc-93 homolog B1-like [Acipenser ruthenus]|uniref:protein unc-93 homolog B1-like n=1 Tax=Acipenser ruthenus TaxID=7906 RepID=UPI002741E97A|nr:protein unc-93 homolog B1-like [Acipenser ruthenus]